MPRSSGPGEPGQDTVPVVAFLGATLQGLWAVWQGWRAPSPIPQPPAGAPDRVTQAIETGRRKAGV
jgi:hypothetical protein